MTKPRPTRIVGGDERAGVHAFEPFEARQAEPFARRGFVFQRASSGPGTSAPRRSPSSTATVPSMRNTPWRMSPDRGAFRRPPSARCWRSAGADEGEHDRQQEQADRRPRLVEDEREVDDGQSPGRGEIPIVLAGEGRPGGGARSFREIPGLRDDAGECGDDHGQPPPAGAGPQAHYLQRRAPPHSWR